MPELDQERLKQLDSNIRGMIENGASEDEVIRYSNDFKAKFGKKKVGGGVSAPNGDPELQKRINTITQYLQNKGNQPVKDVLQTPKPLTTSLGVVNVEVKKQNEQSAFTQIKNKEKNAGFKETPKNTKSQLQAKYGSEWEKKAKPEELKQFGTELTQFYDQQEEEGAPLLDAEEMKKVGEQFEMQKAADEFYKTPLGKSYYNVVNPFLKSTQKAVSNTLSGLVRYGGRATGLSEITEDQADAIDESLDPDKVGTKPILGNFLANNLVDWALENGFNRTNKSKYGFDDVKDVTPKKLQGGLFNNGEINTAKIIPSLVSNLTTMAALVVGNKTPTSLVGRSFFMTEQDYRNEGKKAGLKGQALDNFSFTSAMLTSALEMVSPNTLITGVFKKNFTKEFAKGISEGFTSNIALKMAVKKYGGEIAKENIQEIAQGLGDKVVRYVTDRTSESPIFNDDLSWEGMKDEVYETLFSTTISTGLLSGKGALISSMPTVLEKSTWYNVSKNPEQFKKFVNKQIINGTYSKEESENVFNFFNKYSASVKQAEDFGFSPDQQVEVAYQIYKGQDISEKLKQLKTNPVISKAIEPQLKKEQEDVTNNIKRIGLGVPELGTEITGDQLGGIVMNIGDKGGSGENLKTRIKDNVYRVEEIDLLELYENKKSFKDLVDNYDRKEDNENGLIVPAIINIDGKIIDGRSRLAQQYINGQKTAQVFKELKQNEEDVLEDEEIVVIKEEVKEKKEISNKVVSEDASAIEPPLPKGESIVTLSGITEKERQSKIAERQGDTGLSKSEKIENDLAVLAKKIDKLSRTEKAKAQTNIRQEVRRINAEIGFEKYRYNGAYIVKKRTIRKGSNKGMERWVKVFSINKDVGNQSIKENATVLRDRSVTLQSKFEDIADIVEYLEVPDADGRAMSKDQLESALQDVYDGVPSVQAENLLDIIEAALEKDDFPVKDNFTNQRVGLNDLLGVESEVITAPLTEDALLSWLEDESELTPEQEDILENNFENILYEYTTLEGTQREIPESSEGTKETSIKEVEPEDTNKRIAEEKSRLKEERDERLKEETKPDFTLDFINEEDFPTEKSPLYNKRREKVGEELVPNEKMVTKQNEIKRNFEELQKLTDCLYFKKVKVGKG